MKKVLLFTVGLCLFMSSFAQFNASVQKKSNVIATGQRGVSIDLPVIAQQPQNVLVSNKSVLEDPVTAVTRYDLQSNYTCQRRIYLHPDGTIGTVSTWSTQDASWTDRGSGYNYFDGSAWGSQPDSRVESIRVGWGEYLPFEADGEMIVAHEATGPLVINKRIPKGTGTWTQTVMPPLPSNITAMFWPRSVTNGTNHTNIHIIAITLPTGNGGQLYNGMNGALLYCHSLDGGTTWTPWTQLAGMTGAEYTSFTADSYSWAEPHGDTLAFTEGFSFQDQILMKSTDNGTTWTKTVIYNSPYNLGGGSPHFFYCPDGANSIALDNSGMAHVVFGLMHDSIVDGSTTFNYYPFTDGIAYWDEHMPQLRQDLDPDSLFAKGQLVAWVKDTNVFYMPATQLSYYYTSLSSYPQLVIDKKDKIYLVWSGETALVDPNGYSLRHIFGRDALIDGSGNVVWHNDTLVDLTGDWIQYNFAECMYPSVSPSTDGYLYTIFQKDDYGGSYAESIGRTYQGQTAPDDNSMTVLKWEKPLWTGISNKTQKPTFSVGQNTPNPVNDITKVNVYLQNQGDLSLKVTNITGQTLMTLEKNNVLPGVSQFVIDGSQLSPGIYFYTVKQGSQSITKKMVVD